ATEATMTRNVLELPTLVPEPELATGPRHDRGAGARHALERDGEGRRAGRVPALRLGRLVAARARGRPSVRALGAAEPPGPRGHLPGALRSTARGGVAVQPPERGQARSSHLPVLRGTARCRGDHD